MPITDPDMIQVRRFLPLILPFAPGVPNMVAEFHTRMAAIEYCERTRCWRHIISIEMDYDLITGDGEEAFWGDEPALWGSDPAFWGSLEALGDTGGTEVVVAPDYAAIHFIESAFWDGEVELTPTQYSKVLPSDRESISGPPRYITQVNPNTVTVYPFHPGTLDLTVFLKPRSGTDFTNDPQAPVEDFYNQVPDFLFIQHAEAIAAGALARLLAMPETRWQNPTMAAVYLNKFERYCDTAFSTPVVGQHRAPRRTRMRFV
jgi:hypothetical protein